MNYDKAHKWEGYHNCHRHELRRKFLRVLTPVDCFEGDTESDASFEVGYGFTSNYSIIVRSFDVFLCSPHDDWPKISQSEKRQGK